MVAVASPGRRTKNKIKLTECTCSGTACFAMPHKDILGMDMPGVGGDRRTFDLICYGHSGDKLCELVQIDTGDLPAWGEYMVRLLFLGTCLAL